MLSEEKTTLIEATLQDIYLAIIHRTYVGYARGEEITSLLQANRETWIAAAMGSHSAGRGDFGSAYLLAQLRGLTRNESGGLDALYLLTKDQRSAETWLHTPLYPTHAAILSPAALSQEAAHYADPSEQRLVRLWWDVQLAEAQDAGMAPGASHPDMGLPHETLTLEQAPLQALYLEIIRRQEFNAYEGRTVFEGLLEHRDLWVAALLDRSTVNFELEGEHYMLRLLRRIPDGRLHKHDELYILARNQEAADMLAAQPWATAPAFIQPNLANKFVEFPPEQRLVMCWWD